MGSSAWSSQEDPEQQITKLGMFNQPNLRETIGS